MQLFSVDPLGAIEDQWECIDDMLNSVASLTLGFGHSGFPMQYVQYLEQCAGEHGDKIFPWMEHQPYHTITWIILNIIGIDPSVDGPRWSWQGEEA